MIRFLLIGLVAAHALGAAGLLAAENWATKMFAVTSYDFGAVARGASTQYEFVLENKYVEDVHIASVRASCGCTTPMITKHTLKTWEKGAIVARYNTDRFQGRRGATITVIIDQPYYAEVQLTVTGYIRPDVVFHPGSVNFGEVEQLEGAAQKVQVSYAGRSDWTISDVRSAHSHLEVMLQQPRRSGRNVTYDMTVRLKPGASVGYFKDQLTIVTDDRRNQRLTLPIEGRIRSLLTVSPSSLFLGVLKPEESVTKRLIVQSSKPFLVLGVDCGEDGCFDAELPGSDDAKKVHVIPITYTAGRGAADVEQTITIETNLGTSNTVATGTVMP